MSLSTASVSIRAHAKINLDLRVLGMRADGFHELRTVFQAIALHDTICCVPRAGPFAIECSTAGVPLDHTNLIWRAAATLWRSLRRSGSVRDVVVQLDKRIPLQAGLGGGSADAAATLMALARLWRLRIKPSQFTDIAAHIGSDVPFFLSGGTALGLGRGEEIYPLADLPSISGSGSTVFGLFQKRREAVAAVDRLKGTGWQVLLTESLDRGEYARRAKPRTGRADVRLRTSRTRAAVVKRSA
jgi:4-diphosphocytidyl-2C-methyl-D-erythritol kinase